eukprot:COSAG02_NODE_66_length_42609_cov_95.996848_2_plen_617_part_00
MLQPFQKAEVAEEGVEVMEELEEAAMAESPRSSALSRTESVPPTVHARTSSSSSIELQWAASAWNTTSVQMQYDGEWLTVGMLPASARRFDVGGLLDSRNYTLRLCDGAATPPLPPREANYTGNCTTASFLRGVQLAGCAKILEHEHHFTATASECCARCTNYSRAWGGVASCAAWSWDSIVQHGDCELYGSTDCQHITKHSSTSGLLHNQPGPSPPPLPKLQCSRVVSERTLVVDTTPLGSPIATSNATYPRSGEGTIVRDGNMLFYFYGRWLGNHGDLGESVIVYQSSRDDGASWSDNAVQLTPADGKGRANVGAVVIARGHILISYFVSSRSGTQSTAWRVTRRSTDGGKSFGQEQRLTDDSYIYMTGAHDRLRMLSNGRLLVTVHVKANETMAANNGKLCTLVFYSDDQGSSWQRSPACLRLSGADAHPFRGSTNEGFLEASFVEVGAGQDSEATTVKAKAGQGELLMVGRTSTGWLGQSRSTDFGSTWSNPVHLNTLMRHPMAPPNLARLPDNRLLLVTGPHFDPDQTLYGTRYMLAAQISSDGGSSWYGYRNLQYTGQAVLEHSYCSIFVDDDRVHFTHYRACKTEPCGTKSWRSAQYIQLNMSWFDDDV